MSLVMAISGIAAAVAIVGVTVYKTNAETAYLYANARVISRSSAIADKARLSQLAGSSTLQDFVNSLKDSEYAPYLENIEKNNITQFNMALEEGFIQSLKDIRKISPAKFQKVFDIYQMIVEAKIIKTFYRSRVSNTPIDKTLLAPIGSINPALMTHLHDTKSVADMKVVLRDSNYKEVFDSEYQSVEEFDLALEEHVIRSIDAVLMKSSFHNKDAILSIFTKRREIRQILTLIKCRLREKKIDIRIGSIDTKKALECKDMKEFVDLFANTEYSEVLQKALEESKSEESYYSFEKLLWQHYYERVTGTELRYSIGPYPLLSYIVKKEIEQKNLLIIAKGIASGMEKKDIEGMLI